MQIDLNVSLEVAAGVVTAIGTIYPVFQHLRSKKLKNKENYRKEILDQAKIEMTKIEKSLDDKIKNLEIEFQAQKLNVFKDFTYFKETHNSEMKALGEKIENLRTDLNTQHSNLVALLTKLVNNR